MVSQTDIFPLALSDFEYYAVRDETPDFPMVMILRIHLEGAVDEEIFTGALRVALSQNPLLQSQLREIDGELYWDRLSRPELPLQIKRFHGSSPPDHCEERSFDLYQRCGVQFELRRCDQRSILVCHLHHACVDGLGAIRFLADVFATYGEKTADRQTEKPVARHIDPETLADRGVIPVISREGGRKVKWTEWLKGPLKFLTGRVYSIPPRNLANALHFEEKSVLHTRVLQKSVVRSLKRLAAAQQMSMNDLCMMVYLQQLNRWTKSAPGARGNDLFRILMPVSTRTADHDNISAANMISYVFQPVYRRQCGNPAALAQAIHNRSARMLNDNESAVILKLFSLLRRVPILFRLSQNLQSTFATAVLANVGELKRVFGNRFPLRRGKVVAGNVLIDRIDGIAPLRKNTNVVISFGSYAGELILNLRANPHVLNADDCDVFLDRVTDHLTSIAAAQSLSVSAKNSSKQRPPLAAALS